MVNSIVEYYAEHEGYKCGYCRRPDTNYSHGMWAHMMSVSDYQHLIDRGWRRSGMYCYKPTMDVLCCPMYTIRCRALELKLSKSQKKIMKKMNKYLMSGGTDPEESTSGRMSAASGDDEGEVGGDQFVEAERQCSNVDINAVIIDSAIQPDSTLKTSTEEESAKESSNVKITPTEKSVKPGLGLDSSKGPCKKSKQLRLERKMEKLRQKGIDISAMQTNSKNVEKQLEDFLEEIPEEIRNKLEVRLVRTNPPSAEWLASAKEAHRVYSLYQMSVHGDTAQKCSEPKFHDFLVRSPLQEEYSPDGPEHGYGSFHQQYWLEGRMVATGVIDILPACVSSVYFFYDPKYRNLTLGTYGALRELAFTRQLNKTCPNIKYYYMGFYIHSCRKMRYKGNFHPSDLLCPETYKWFPITECIPKLDVSPYARLNPDIDAIDEDACTPTQLGDIPLLVNMRPIRYRQYKSTKEGKKMRKEEEDNIKEYSQLVGATCARSIILFR